ncbi:MAG: cyclase family protein [Rhodospirillales bacterium]|nr:cyclase family protein [Rhodospirillales bacterium]MCB9996243.1 cyclase family protein [Rhodospirillales bacterium]
MLGTYLFAILITAGAGAYAQIAKNEAAQSPWGPDDEIGTLNMMDDASRLDILKQIASGRVYDLSVDMFIGMPTCCDAFGDQGYEMWMTHTPERGEDGNLVSHSGEAVSMYTHTGTHIDALNHFGLHGEIWNKVHANDALDTRGWKKTGVDKQPPIIARGVLIDVARAKNVERLPDSYSITASDLQEALQKQGTIITAGDVVLIRTGLMTLWPDAQKYSLFTQAGLSLEAAQWLAEEQKVMVIGADNFGVEAFPSKDPKNFAPVHSYLLAEKGVSLIEVLWLEDLAKDQVYDFMFIASPLKMRGATASPIRPLAIPIQQSSNQ